MPADPRHLSAADAAELGATATGRLTMLVMKMSAKLADLKADVADFRILHRATVATVRASRDREPNGQAWRDLMAVAHDQIDRLSQRVEGIEVSMAQMQQRHENEMNALRSAPVAETTKTAKFVYDSLGRVTGAKIEQAPV